jgi:gliding motility-associated-like protein
MLGAGNYEVTVTDNTGICSETGSFTVNEPPAIEVDYKLTEPECFNDPGYMEILAVENAAGDWVAEIIGNSTEVLPGTFEVDAGLPMRLVITDDKGCEASENFLIPAKQELYVDLGPDQEIKYGETVFLDADIFPFSNVQLEWFPTEFLSCTDCPNPETSPTESIAYQLRLTDENGCIAEDEISINVYKSRDLYIPNAFSPNQDGINDIFCPMGGFEVVSVQSMQVFDRWGGLIFSNQEGFSIHDSEKIGWDGKARGKEMDTGTYLYTMNVEFIDGEVILFSGEVNLLR